MDAQAIGVNSNGFASLLNFLFQFFQVFQVVAKSSPIPVAFGPLTRLFVTSRVWSIDSSWSSNSDLLRRAFHHF